MSGSSSLLRVRDLSGHKLPLAPVHPNPQESLVSLPYLSGRSQFHPRKVSRILGDGTQLRPPSSGLTRTARIISSDQVPRSAKARRAGQNVTKLAIRRQLPKVPNEPMHCVTNKVDKFVSLMMTVPMTLGSREICSPSRGEGLPTSSSSNCTVVDNSKELQPRPCSVLNISFVV